MTDEVIILTGLKYIMNAYPNYKCNILFKFYRSCVKWALFCHFPSIGKVKITVVKLFVQGHMTVVLRA